MKKNLIYILIAIVVIILIVIFAMGGKKTSTPNDLQAPEETPTTLETPEIKPPAETPEAPAAP